MGKPKEFEMPKGKILMGKDPIKRPEPVKPKPKGGIVDPKRKPKPDGAKKRALPMPKPKPGEPAQKREKQRRDIFDTQKKQRSIFDTPKGISNRGGSIKRKPVMPPKKSGR
jgi:hypothetical protein